VTTLLELPSDAGPLDGDAGKVGAFSLLMGADIQPALEAEFFHAVVYSWAATSTSAGGGV
jgi:hypothetical protein